MYLGYAQVNLTSEGTGKVMSAALMDGVFDWSVVGNINAISFDTTSGNTGKRIGACTLFQHRFGRNVLHLECLLTFMRSCWRHLASQCHHQVAPIVQFSNALAFWPNIMYSDYKLGIEVSDLSNALIHVLNEMKTSLTG